MKAIVSLITLITLTLSLKAQVRENANFIDSISSKVVEINEELIKIQDNYYAIISNGMAGNIGVFINNAGVILIDDQWSLLSKKIKELLLTVTPKPVKAIINTHYHFDHTNGNIFFGSEKIQIISHENARTRMSEKQVIIPILKGLGPDNIVQKSYPPEALPTLTFTDKLTLYSGTEIIDLIHFKYAHTDGDAVVHFKNPDIYHTGDIFVMYGLPFIDEKAGGDIYAMIDAIDTLLSQSNEKTKFIPGHGPVCSIKELKEYRDLLFTIQNNVETLTREKRNLDDILKSTTAKIPFETEDADNFIEQVYRSVKRHLNN
jgi:glyoxylase-like metal-dependent hydrolase (beta-lactamase superfamily II)